MIHWKPGPGVSACRLTPAAFGERLPLPRLNTQLLAGRQTRSTVKGFKTLIHAWEWLVFQANRNFATPQVRDVVEAVRDPGTWKTL
jgi:hypothetical protein